MFVHDPLLSRRAEVGLEKSRGKTMALIWSQGAREGRWDSSSRDNASDSQQWHICKFPDLRPGNWPCSKWQRQLEEIILQKTRLFLFFFVATSLYFSS